MRSEHLDHPTGEPCVICDAERLERRATNEEIQELYAALDSINMGPPYGNLIRELNKDLAREGKRRIHFLSELASGEVAKLIDYCRKHARSSS